MFLLNKEEGEIMASI